MIYQNRNSELNLINYYPNRFELREMSLGGCDWMSVEQSAASVCYPIKRWTRPRDHHDSLSWMDTSDWYQQINVEITSDGCFSSPE